MRGFGARLKALRESRGLTMRDLEKKTWVTRGAICQFENDQHFPSLSTLIDLCDSLELTREERCNLVFGLQSQ